MDSGLADDKFAPSIQHKKTLHKYQIVHYTHTEQLNNLRQGQRRSYKQILKCT